MTDVIPQPATIDSLSAFLKYGPTGLAGLMLLLVVVALLVRELKPASERVLLRLMYIGAFCFALSLGANFFSVTGAYKLYMRVLPLDMGAKRTLPMPIIKANGTLLDENMTYVVKSEVTAIIDVSDAINFVQEVRLQNDRQRQVISNVVSASTAIVADLQKVPQILDRNCSGGSSGIPAASNPAVIAITSKAASTIAGFSSSGADLVGTPPPTFR